MEFSPYTPNIDSSILGKIQTPDILGGIQKGMALRDQMDKKKEEDKLKTDMTAATQGLDATTEQGMAQVAARLLQSGHQAEAMQIHKMAMDLHEKAAKSYQSVDYGEQGLGSFDTSTGVHTPPPTPPPSNPYGDIQSMGNQAPPMISNAPMAPDAPQGFGMPQMSQPPQAAPSAPPSAPMTQAAPITSAAYQKSKAEFDLKKAARDADAAFQADIPTYEGQIKSIGSDMTKRDLIASQIMAKHGGSSLAKDYVSSVLKPNAASSSWSSPPAQAQVDSWAQGLANGTRGMDDFYKAAMGIRGPARQKFIDDGINGAQKIDPTFSPTQARIGFKEAENHSNQRTLGLIQGVLPNIQELIKLSDKINRSGIKFVSHAELAANRQFSDSDVANFDKMKTITADEINQIFAGGQGGSETSRQMALGLIDQDLPPATFSKSLSTVYQAMQNRKFGITSRMGKYGAAQSADDAGQTPIGAPKAGDTKKNAHGDTVKFNGTGWELAQ